MLHESFYYRDGTLWCDGVALDSVADAVGTPAYIYSAARLEANTHRLQTAFDLLHVAMHYSMKANANLALLRLLHARGLGVDAVSAGEIFRAQRAGIDPAQIVFAGVGKTRDELAYGLDAGVGWFNVESLDELALLNALAGERACTPVVALRLNPGVDVQTHRHIATGRPDSKFGMTVEVIRDALARRHAYPHVHIAGIHLHIGSQLASVEETVEAVRIAQALAAPYHDLRTVNIGGGFPVPYTEADEYPTPADFAAALAPLLHGWHVLLEPGRAIVADAGLLVVSVLYNKDPFVITDGSMAEFLRPALYDAVHPVVPLQRSASPSRPTMVAGPVCESADVLSRRAMLPELTALDRLAVLGTGAYGMVMASNYNMRPRPPEVLVEGSTWRIIRRRETWDDLLRLESD